MIKHEAMSYLWENSPDIKINRMLAMQTMLLPLLLRQILSGKSRHILEQAWKFINPYTQSHRVLCVPQRMQVFQVQKYIKCDLCFHWPQLFSCFSSHHISRQWRLARSWSRTISWKEGQWVANLPSTHLFEEKSAL